MTTCYANFLSGKSYRAAATGLDVEFSALNPALFDWQAALVRWALKKGRAAFFEDCGMGKTLQSLAWAQHIPGDVLILAPLAVAQQTVAEAARFTIPDVSLARRSSEIRSRITVSNYERLDGFDVSRFAGVVLDESSILKSYDGATRTALIEAFATTPYRLCCTATPSPNDHAELGNHSEFLGIMTRAEMLAMFFTHDGGQTQKWRLKRHGAKEFWRWVCSWGVFARSPADIGYQTEGYELPPLTIEPVVCPTVPLPGQLIPLEALTLTDRLTVRRETVQERAKATAERVNVTSGPWIVWCHLNAEADALLAAIPDAVEIRGSDDVEDKETTLARFAAGEIRVLVTKPRIAGFGMNWQHCHQMAFVGLSDSWEEYYQAIRRCWRFGQREPVRVLCVSADAEGAVVSNLKRKDADAAHMAARMVELTKDGIAQELATLKAHEQREDYGRDKAQGPHWTMFQGDCVDVVADMTDESVDYTVFSPPFASLYTYSDSWRDMGNCDDAEQFFEHFGFLVPHLYRVTKPGRLLSFHCMNLPTSKTRDGFIGLRDFRGELIRVFLTHGWIYHSEVVIWKDPVTAMQRTKALGLLYKQLRKDSAMSRQGIPDYLVTVRKPGDNAERVTKTHESFPVDRWQRYASPVWMDIRPSDTLNVRAARDKQDERHIAPLQLEVVRRAIELWTNPDDLVLSPFAGIGSEGVVAVREGRRFVGVELKPSYWREACRNLAAAESERASGDLFTAVSSP